jgi:uncharacterized protein YbaR (Trm112 family)
MSEFKVIKIYPVGKSGTIHEYIEVLKCPRCKREFTRPVTSGSFDETRLLVQCPYCNYPLQATQEEEKEEEMNPSKR